MKNRKMGCLWTALAGLGLFILTLVFAQLFVHLLASMGGDKVFEDMEGAEAAKHVVENHVKVKEAFGEVSSVRQSSLISMSDKGLLRPSEYWRIYTFVVEGDSGAAEVRVALRRYGTAPWSLEGLEADGQAWKPVSSKVLEEAEPMTGAEQAEIFPSMSLPSFPGPDRVPRGDAEVFEQQIDAPRSQEKHGG